MKRRGLFSRRSACGVVAATYHQTLSRTFIHSNAFCSGKNTKSISDFAPFHQTENIFHLILIDCMISSPPCSDNAVTSLQSPIQTFIQDYFAKHSLRHNFHATSENSFSALCCVCACCSAYQTDKLSRPLRYLTQTAHASISSSASISLSVTACLFIQLELFESLELP